MYIRLIPLFLTLFLFTSCSKSNKSILDDYVQSHNNHNIEKSLSYFSDDVIFELAGVWVKMGKSKVRELEEWDSELNSQLNFIVHKENGDTLFCTGIEKNDWFTSVGINEVNYDSIIFIFEDKKIKRVFAKTSPEINIKVAEAMKSIVEFTKLTNNNILSQLIPKGEFVYSRESAQQWIKLLEAWKNEKEY